MFQISEYIGFERDKDGGVVVKILKDGLDSHTIEPHEWASVMTEVSHRPQNAEAFQEALKFHMGG